MDAVQSSKLWFGLLAGVDDVTIDLCILISDGIDAPRWMFWKRRRYIVVLMAFLGCLVMYAMWVAMSIAVVAMTEKRAISFQNGTVGYVSLFFFVCFNRDNKC